MQKTKILWICALFAVVSLFAAVGCAKKPFDGSIPEAVLCDFEQWAPDFQTLRVRNEFGSVDVNTTADYVKSGKQSAALTVVGSDQNMMPYFFVNTTSALFDYDYSDFSKIDSVRAWFYNPSQTEEKLYVGLITEIVSVEQDNLQKFDTFTLSSGWNEIVYRPDMNYIISAVGQSKYDGIKGVYFMFDNPHASNKAEGKRFYVDDITLKYGAEKPYTPVRAGSYYTTGVQIGAPSWIILENPVKMTALENKALHFEFKFDSDVGRFGFAICCDDYNWSNITGTLVIEKQAGGAIVANMGKIKALEDGWYAWELNRDMFRGNGASIAEDVSLIYHQGETVQGNVIIDWNSMQAVDAYTLTKEERSETFVEGDKIEHYFYEKGIAMSALENKAMQLDFKFTSDTGRFGFAFLDNLHDWANITGSLVVPKNSDGTVTANMGKVVALEDGWYAWKLNRADFAGGGVGSAVTVDLVWHNDGVDGIATSVLGTVMIDWNSMQAVDAYTLTKEERASRYTTDMEINGNYTGAPTLFEPIAIAEFAGKAVHFEFKFVTETGKFGFAILDNPGWANITGTLTIEKKADGTIESNIGRVMELEDGWYAWELNSESFGGDGAEKAENVGLIYNQREKVQGEVLIDWESLAAVEPQTYFSSNNKIDWSFSSGNGIVSQIPSENGRHNALKITNDNTHSQAQWMYFVLQLDPATIAKLDNAKELALKLKLQRNTAASNVTFNFRISPAKLINDKWEPDNQNWAKNATDSGVDGYSNNVELDTWHTIRFLRNTCWGSDTIAALKANGGKILIFVELKNNNTSADFDSGTDFGFNLIIDDMTVTEYKYILDFENASDADLLQTRSYDSGRVSTCELSAEQKVSGEKSVKVYQNQHGALVVKIPDAMKAAMDGNAKLSVRFNLTQVTKDGAPVPEPNPVPTVAFYACSTPNPDTDKADGTWKDCQISGKDLQANVSQNTWYTKQLSDELTAKIKTNGYLWIEVEMQNWQCYTFYVDFITLE